MLLLQLVSHMQHSSAACYEHCSLGHFLALPLSVCVCQVYGRIVLQGIVGQIRHVVVLLLLSNAGCEGIICNVTAGVC
jgi:hypothetical protein